MTFVLCCFTSLFWKFAQNLSESKEQLFVAHQLILKSLYHGSKATQLQGPIQQRICILKAELTIIYLSMSVPKCATLSVIRVHIMHRIIQILILNIHNYGWKFHLVHVRPTFEVHLS